jgi:hypothetical protein
MQDRRPTPWRCHPCQISRTYVRLHLGKSMRQLPPPDGKSPGRSSLSAPQSRHDWAMAKDHRLVWRRQANPLSGRRLADDLRCEVPLGRLRTIKIRAFPEVWWGCGEIASSLLFPPWEANAVPLSTRRLLPFALAMGTIGVSSVMLAPVTSAEAATAPSVSNFTFSGALTGKLSESDPSCEVVNAHKATIAYSDFKLAGSSLHNWLIVVTVGGAKN